MKDFSIGDKVINLGNNHSGVIQRFFHFENDDIALIKIGDGSLEKVSVENLILAKDLHQEEAEKLAEKLLDPVEDEALNLLDNVTITQEEFKEISTEIIVSECSAIPYLSELVASIVAKIHVAIFEDGEIDEAL